MSIRDLLFKAVMNRAPRVRGFTKKCYFAHPFLDAFFVWFPLGDMKYGGAEIGEIYEVAARINERDPMSWGKDAILQVHEFDKLLASTNKTKRITTGEGAEAHCQLNNFGIQHQISYDFI